MRSSTPDAELVARCRRQSDADAFRELVERHKRLVFAVALAHAGDPALAEDVAQEAFVAAWRDMGGLREPDRVGSWVAGIARNLAQGAVRRHLRRQRHALDQPPPPATPEDEVRAREDRELLGRALAEVPAAHREVLVLHYLEGMPVAQIAEELGVREDLVKQRLSRGRRSLRTSVAARVEAALVRARPGPEFGAVVVATATGKHAAASAAGKGVAIMSMKKAAIAATALVTAAVAGGAVYLARASGDEEARPSAAHAGHAQNRPAGTPAARAAEEAAAPAMVRRIDPATRATRLEAIRRLHSASGSGGDRRTGAREAPPALATAEGDLDKEYIREAVGGIRPLLAECYEEGLERNPALAGAVVVDFTIEGEPEVGGVVGESSIQKSTLDDPAVLECIQETMYALEIDPPTGGGVVQVSYPFKFAPSDDGEGP